MDMAEIDRIASNLKTLSPREMEVFHLAADLVTNAEMADHLGINMRTLESHRAAIREKLGVPRWVQVIAFRQLQIMQVVPARAPLSEAARIAAVIADDVRQLAAIDDATGGSPSERLRIIWEMVSAAARHQPRPVLRRRP
jgi:DNA-binding CsgD family transcriptional regulator